MLHQIVAIGLGAAALLGLGGAAVGAMPTSENAADMGAPKDDTLLYRALKRGRSLVVADIGDPD